MRGHRDAQKLKNCPLIVHRRWHRGQHSPLGTTSSSPSSQVGLRQVTAEQLRVHVRQHSPLRLVSVCPSRHFGRRHSVSKQPAGTQSGQHFPGSNNCSSPSPQLEQICVAQSVPIPADGGGGGGGGGEGYGIRILIFSW